MWLSVGIWKKKVELVWAFETWCITVEICPFPAMKTPTPSHPQSPEHSDENIHQGTNLYIPIYSMQRIFMAYFICSITKARIAYITKARIA